jgi:hypothetical protein
MHITFYKSLSRRKIFLCSLIPLSSSADIGYRCFVIDIDAALLDCGIMQSCDFDTVSYVDEKKGVKSVVSGWFGDNSKNS